MYTLKITIEGDFWDCQIYMGRLYLWTMSGELHVINWDELVNSLNPPNSDNHLIMRCAFTHGDYLYGKELRSIFEDREFKNLLAQKFKRIFKEDFRVDKRYLEKFNFGVQNNPFRELPTDTEISNKVLYGLTDAGIFAASAHRHNIKYPVSSKPSKIWDCPTLSVKANRFGQLSISAGDEGLFEFNRSTEYFDSEGLRKVEDSIFQIGKHHSQFSDWSFLSIYSSSNVDGSFMAFYEWDNKGNIEGLKPNENDYKFSSKRKLTSEIKEEEIFGKNKKGLSWGGGDKIYKAYDGKFLMARFKNTLYMDSDEDAHFYDTHSISLDAWKGDVVSGGTAYFGTIVECENALVVVLSNKEVITIKGPITRWRVYPRSINYENHLHVILEDKIEIYSFNNDYFVDQKEKEFGLFYKPDLKRRRARLFGI